MSKRTEEAIESTLREAFTLHSTEFRKNGLLPYIIHPLDVMRTLNYWGVEDLLTLQGALLHDTWESNPHLFHSHFATTFGGEVADLVEELTFRPNPSNPKAKAEYLASFQNVSVRALLIKMADRLCNTNDFKHSNPDYAVKYWHKASELGKAFYDRFNEVSDFYGTDIVQAALSQWSDMDQWADFEAAHG